MKKLFLVIAFFFIAVGRLSAYSSPGKPTGFVNDYAGLLSVSEKQNLENRLSQLYASTSAQVAVVTINNLGGDSIENYAVKLFEEWGIGVKGEDNGVLFLTALEDREIRIEVGYGLEGTLTDAESSVIIRRIITPAYKLEQYGTGIIDGTNAIIAAIEGNLPISSNADKAEDSEDGPGVGILFFGYFLIQALTGMLSRTKSWWLGGILGGILGAIVTMVYGFMMAGLLAFGVLVPLGLLFDYLLSKNPPQNSGNTTPWWSGGSSFSGGRSSGGFGGFGGGRSGGGGSSGRW